MVDSIFPIFLECHACTQSNSFYFSPHQKGIQDSLGLGFPVVDSVELGFWIPCITSGIPDSSTVFRIPQVHYLHCYTPHSTTKIQESGYSLTWDGVLARAKELTRHKRSNDLLLRNQLSKFKQS